MDNDMIFGWIKDPTDFRDFHPDSEERASFDENTNEKTSVKEMLDALNIEKDENNMKFPKKWDLHDIFDTIPVEDQRPFQACTPNAAIGLLEYFVKKVHDVHMNSSRQFLYKTTRNVLKIQGDYGAHIRNTIGAMRLFGVLPEEYWPYDIGVRKEPTAFCYAFAQNFKALSYFRLDQPDVSPTSLLCRIRYYLHRGFPLIFGFEAHLSMQESWTNNGEIPFPNSREGTPSYHCVIAMGYDDNKELNNNNGGGKVKGAIKIRNSWGNDWGENGYGWIPYEFVLRGMATDWWSLIQNDWVDLEKFK